MGVDFADAAENADAVNAVNHVVAGGKLGEAVDLLTLFFAAPSALLLGSVGVVAEGDDEEFLARQLKACRKRARHYVEPALCRFIERTDKLRVVAVGNEVVAEILCRLFGAGENHAAAVGSKESVQILAQLLVGTRPVRELLCRKRDYLGKLQINAAVHKAFEQNNAVRGKKLHALVVCQLKTVEAACQKTFL